MEVAANIWWDHSLDPSLRYDWYFNETYFCLSFCEWVWTPRRAWGFSGSSMLSPKRSKQPVTNLSLQVSVKNLACRVSVQVQDLANVSDPLSTDLILTPLIQHLHFELCLKCWKAAYSCFSHVHARDLWNWSGATLVQQARCAWLCLSHRDLYLQFWLRRTV